KKVAAARAAKTGAAESGTDIFGALPASMAKVRGQEAATRTRSELAEAKARAEKAEAAAARLRAQMKGKTE
ncbi:MAG: protein TolA, partial [Planctomycetia bacterium]|nr:protein TolA [Planctomycetia bacterium]